MFELDITQTLQKISEKTNKQIKELVDELVKTRMTADPEIVRNDEIAVFLLASKYGVQPVIKLSTSVQQKKVAKDVKISDLLFADGNERYNLCGYMFSVKRQKSKNNFDFFTGTLYDETGKIRFVCFAKEYDLRSGMFVDLKNALLQISENERTVIINDSTEVNITVPKLNLRTLAKQIEEAKNGDIVFVSGVVVEKQERSYLGCPICRKKLSEAQKENEQIICSKCNKYVQATKYVWKRYTVSDGVRIFLVVSSPFNQSQIDLNVGDQVKLFGIFDNGEIEIEIVDVRKSVAVFDEKVSQSVTEMKSEIFEKIKAYERINLNTLARLISAKYGVEVSFAMKTILDCLNGNQQFKVNGDDVVYVGQQ